MASACRGPQDPASAVFLLELLVYPAVFYLWKKKGLAEGPANEAPSEPHPVAAVAGA